MNIFDSALVQLKKVADSIDLPEGLLERLQNPDRTIQLNFPLKKDGGSLKIMNGYQQKIFVEENTFLQRALSFKFLLSITILTFSILAFLAHHYKYFNFDLTITVFIQQFNAFWFDGLMKLITFIGNPIPVTVLIFLVTICGYLFAGKKTALAIVFSTTGGIILSTILKIIVARPRPDPHLINQIGQYFQADSFPSGHVLESVSLFGFVLYFAYTHLKIGWFRRIVIVKCIAVMILMGLSRIYLGAHWFSDVLGAYLIGFVWLAVVVSIHHKVKI